MFDRCAIAKEIAEDIEKKECERDSEKCKIVYNIIDDLIIKECIEFKDILKETIKNIEIFGGKYNVKRYTRGYTLNNEFFGEIDYYIFDGKMDITDVYISLKKRRKGFGTKLVKELIEDHEELKEVITLPSPISEGMFEKLGFRYSDKYEGYMILKLTNV